MMRPSTVLWIALAGGVGIGVYQLKHRVQALEDELFRLNRAIVHEQDAIHVLRAEWAYINQPRRLESLAQRHLAMQAMVPAQLGQVADLPRRPPSPPAPPAEPLLAALPALPTPARPMPRGDAGAAGASPIVPSQTEGRAPAEGRASAPAARAPQPALAPNSRPPASAPPPPESEASLSDLLAAMRPPPGLARAGGVGDAYAGSVGAAGAYAGSGRPSPPAARMPAPRALADPNLQAAGGPAAIGVR